MRLKSAQVRKYWSIRDTGKFEIEEHKTILVGPNEAGKTALLRALQQINPPDGVEKLDALRDYPRSEYSNIDTGEVVPKKTTIVTGWFVLDDEDKSVLEERFKNCTFIVSRRLDNSVSHSLEGGPQIPTYSMVKADFRKLAVHADGQLSAPAEGAKESRKPSVGLVELTKDIADEQKIEGDLADKLIGWLEAQKGYFESDASQQERSSKLRISATIAKDRQAAIKELAKRVPILVLFGNYVRVHPRIHLMHLASRLESQVLDDAQYDYGNQCLLKLLGLTARELSDLGNVPEPKPNDVEALKLYRRQLDTRHYRLNAASVRLTDSINRVWAPDKKRDEASVLRIVPDRQYLKVVVQDEIGVEVELDQRSEGYRWLVSFYIVFFAEAQGTHKNAILLLDEPGLSLHGLKQREFRRTVSLLAESNQTIYTTHSPFLVGPDELDMVRVIEMTDRHTGTQVHTTLTANDPAALLPLQEALGYDLAQSLFAQQRNLVLEGLTDYWYVEAIGALLRDSGHEGIAENIALVPAGNAGKVVYFATILHAQKLKVAALLDSDAAGDQAAEQDTLVHTLGNKRILRTKDAYSGAVKHPEIEDVLRDTLVQIAKSELGCDITALAQAQSTRPVAELLNDKCPGFSKYRLAKAFLKWSRSHGANDLTATELQQCKELAARINKALPQ